MYIWLLRYFFLDVFQCWCGILLSNGCMAFSCWMFVYIYFIFAINRASINIFMFWLPPFCIFFSLEIDFQKWDQLEKVTVDVLVGAQFLPRDRQRGCGCQLWDSVWQETNWAHSEQCSGRYLRVPRAYVTQNRDANLAHCSGGWVQNQGPWCCHDRQGRKEFRLPSLGTLSSEALQCRYRTIKKRQTTQNPWLTH